MQAWTQVKVLSYWPLTPNLYTLNFETKYVRAAEDVEVEKHLNEAEEAD